MTDDQASDEFWLYDLKVETVLDGRTPVCRHLEGDSFTVEGELLVFRENQRVSMYALAAVLPFLPAKQRETADNDWMSTDAEIACPDPHCGGRFRISRIGKRRFSHAETTGLPDRRATPYWQGDDVMTGVETGALAPELRHLPRHQGRLAACRRPRPGRPGSRDRRYGGVSRRRRHDVRLRRYLYRR